MVKKANEDSASSTGAASLICVEYMGITQRSYAMNAAVFWANSSQPLGYALGTVAKLSNRDIIPHFHETPSNPPPPHLSL
jgi:hypothetical protein